MIKTVFSSSLFSSIFGDLLVVVSLRFDSIRPSVYPSQTIIGFLFPFRTVLY